MLVVVPSFVSTFLTPSMLLSISSIVNVYNLQNGAIHNITDCSAVFALPLLDQAFTVGPGFSPVPSKIVAQIVAGKFINLSELLAVNLVQKDPELHVIGWPACVDLSTKKTTPAHRGHHVLEAFAIFSLILVHHFPHRWKDLMQ